jgi:phosphatidylserine/phosphatidylglycerophosphate/cardiolipin synthase-like enzyme
VIVRSREETALLAGVRDFARQVESGITKKIVRRLLQLTADADQQTRAAAMAVAASGESAARIARLERAWAKSPSVGPQALAWALEAAEATDEWHRRSVTTDLVWTGPLGLGSAFRRTDQALLEVIEKACHQLLVVSFATYRVEALGRALQAAVERGVKVVMVLETEDSSGSKYTGDPRTALGKDLMKSIEMVVWPLEKRQTFVAPAGKKSWGVLHAKCAVADDRWLFVSSANLTGSAMAVNMELGVLVEGGDLPRMVSKHFAELLVAGTLVRMS